MTHPPRTVRLPINQFYYQILNKEKRSEHDKSVSWKIYVRDVHFDILGLVVNDEQPLHMTWKYGCLL